MVIVQERGLLAKVLLCTKQVYFNCSILTGPRSSKSKISPHKHNTEQERHTVNKTKSSNEEGSVTKNSQTTVKTTSPEDKAGKLQAAQETGHNNEDKYSTTKTAIKSILKRTNEQPSTEKSLPGDSLDQSKTITSSNATKDDNEEMFDVDDTEQPFASLTEEEKKIIGLMACPSNGNGQSNLAVNKSTDSMSPVSDLSAISSTYSHSSASTKSSKNDTGDEGIMSSIQGDIDTHDTLNVVKREQVTISSSQNERLNYINVPNVVDEVDEMPEGSGLCCRSERPNLNETTKEKSNKADKPRKRKSIQLQISDEGCQDKAPLKDIIAAKKRKSQQLPFVTTCSNNSHAVKDEERSKVETCINQETTLQQFFMSTSKSPKGAEHSRKVTPSDISPGIKRQKAVSDSPVKLKEKSPIKDLTKESVHVPKKKLAMTDAEINFFVPSKKAKKSDKVEKPKNDKEKTTPVKTLKPKIEKKGLERNKILQKTKPKTMVPVTILSSDDSNMCSTDNCDSSVEEQDSLKKIWDDFELPQNDDVIEEDILIQWPIKNQTQELSRKRMPSTSTDAGTEKQPSLVNALGLGKKQRIAHTSSHVSKVCNVFCTCFLGQTH